MKFLISTLVLFYYTGHGCGDYGGGHWPIIAVQGSLMESAECRKLLKDGKHRLAIILLDCCNSVSRQKGFSDESLPVIHSWQHLRGLKTLFLETKGIIMASAATRGEFAKCGDLGHNVIGGYFTTALLRALIKNCQDLDISWKHDFARNT